MEIGVSIEQRAHPLSQLIDQLACHLQCMYYIHTELIEPLPDTITLPYVTVPNIEVGGMLVIR